MTTTVNRNLGTDWRLAVQSPTRPHGGRFENLVRSAENAFVAAAAQLRLVDQCLGLLEAHEDAAVSTYEVAPGGLTYQDAALQCLLGGCVESLEAISDRAAVRINHERDVVEAYRLLRANHAPVDYTVRIPAWWYAGHGSWCVYNECPDVKCPWGVA